QWNYEKNIVPYLESMDKYLKNNVKVILGGGREIDFPEFKNIENVMVIKSLEDFDKMLIEIKLSLR
ncbi:MAG: hypothetical protein HOF14_02985, partial [Deltaproteobacteria bacterium]|nr:hypothetical protein [Deltaproteobacteria bacterium]